MRCARLAALIAMVLLAGPRAAQAGLFELYGQLQGGGGFGRGKTAPTSKDFFEMVQGADAGGELGIEILYLDLFVDHYEFFSDRVKGQWTQFMLGVDANFPMDDDHMTQGTIGVDAGLGVGGLQSSLFSSGTQRISAEGVAAEVRLQGDRLLGRYASVGLDLRLGYHLLIDQDRPINEPDATSQGVHLFGGIAFKVRFGTN